MATSSRPEADLDPDPRIEHATVWARQFVAAWQAAWRAAPPDVQANVRTYFHPCDGSMHALIRLRVDDGSPVLAFGLELREAPTDLGLDVDVVVIRDRSARSSDEVAQRIEYFMRNMLQNWSLGRAIDERLVPHAASMGHLDGAVGCYVVVPGSPASLSVEDLVAHCFRETAPRTENPPVPSAPAAAPPRHLYHLHQDREDTAIERWMFDDCGGLLCELGLSFGWWCALWPRRDDIFGDGADGDVDLVAGPLTFDFDDAEMDRRVRAEAERRPLATNHGVVRSIAIGNAAREGHVVWPPSTDVVVACEVKASRYDERGWRTTHLGESARVKGQLRYLLGHGVDRVALLHLCATKPRDASTGNPWLAAGKDVEDALASMQLIFAPEELPTCGYFAAVLGAVERGEEHFEGAGSGLVVAQRATETEGRAEGVSWRVRLRDRLRAMACPTTLRTFIRRCEKCGAWRHAAIGIPQASPCPCRVAT